jgi:ankyrin repeat protein
MAEPLIQALTTGDVAHLTHLLTENPALATRRADGRTALHIYADAPGHRPNPEGIVRALLAAGADVNAQATEMWHQETPLHWAASNDDVPLIDALLDAGADIEHPGSSINGGPPMASAVGYAQWSAARRLRQRGAQATLPAAGALGDLPLLRKLTETTPPPPAEEVSTAFWNACRAGNLAAAQYLLAHGANPNWPAPWSGETPMDVVHENVATWLTVITG